MTADDIRLNMLARTDWLLSDLENQRFDQHEQKVERVIKELKKFYELGQDHPYTDLD
jgi:hypothetical protein